MTTDAFEVGDEKYQLGPETSTELTGAERCPPESQSQLQDTGLDDIRARVGTLLKTETVSLLLGAGASLDCGGQLIGSIPLQLEQGLATSGISGSNPSRVRTWLKLFYLAVSRTSMENIPVSRKHILDRRDQLNRDCAKKLKVNFEQVLSTLHSWRATLQGNGGRLRLDGSPPVDARASEIDACLEYSTGELAKACNLPTAKKISQLETHKTLIRKLLTRPPNLKRVNIFTLNYDTLIEQAADASGVVLLDGFVGTQRRTFRPESYDHDLYFPGDTTEGRVHRSDRVLRLYKLHGSITWTAERPSMDNPYGVRFAQLPSEVDRPLLIYPTPSKYGETLGHPYSELFRRFAGTLVRPQSVLIVIGYGFGDEHVNAIIRQALAIPSFTLVIVDPNPKSDFVSTLRQQQDRRIWIIRGHTFGTTKGFTNAVLPDLRDEEIRAKVIETHNALARTHKHSGGSRDVS